MQELPDGVFDVSDMEVSRLHHTSAAKACIEMKVVRPSDGLVVIIANLSMNAIHEIMKVPSPAERVRAGDTTVRAQVVESVVTTLRKAGYG